MSAYKYKLNSTQFCHYKLKPNTDPHPYDCKIIDRKKAENQNGNLYKIHWVGWKAKFDLWIPEEILNSKTHFTDNKGKSGKWENNNANKGSKPKIIPLVQKVKVVPKKEEKEKSEKIEKPAKKPQVINETLSVVKFEKNTFSNLKRKKSTENSSIISPKTSKKGNNTSNGNVYIFDGACNKSPLPESPSKNKNKKDKNLKVITPDSEQIKARKNVQSVTISFGTPKSSKNNIISPAGPKNPLLVKSTKLDTFFNFKIYPSRLSNDNDYSWISPNIMCLIQHESDQISKKFINSVAIILSIDSSKKNCQLFVPQFQKTLSNISINNSKSSKNNKNILLPIRPSRSEQQVKLLKNDDYKHKAGWIVSTNKAQEIVDSYTAVVKINDGGPVKIYQLADLALVMDWRKMCFEM